MARVLDPAAVLAPEDGDHSICVFFLIRCEHNPHGPVRLKHHVLDQARRVGPPRELDVLIDSRHYGPVDDSIKAGKGASGDWSNVEFEMDVHSGSVPNGEWKRCGPSHLISPQCGAAVKGSGLPSDQPMGRFTRRLGRTWEARAYAASGKRFSYSASSWSAMVAARSGVICLR